MNKIILITGATDGIGKETAKVLARKGNTIIIHGRNKQKALNTVEELKRNTGNNNITYVLANLLSFSEIQKMANEIKQKYTHLDVLINNAGAVFSKERKLTIDGEEQTMQLNVFAPFLLSRLLLPLLQKSQSARIIIESSAAHSTARKPDFNDMKSEKNYGAQENYSLSKLYVIWMAQRFNKFLQNEKINNVTINVTHPGAAATSFGQNVDKGFFTNLIYKFSLLFMSKPETAARSEIFLATSPKVEGISGKYFDNKGRQTKPNKRHYTKENEELIWKYCNKICQSYLNN